MKFTKLTLVALGLVLMLLTVGVAWAASNYISTHITAITITAPVPDAQFTETFNGVPVAQNSNGITWPSAQAGATVQVPYSIKNTGNVAFTYTFTTSITLGWSLTWGTNGTGTVAVGDTIYGTLQLTSMATTTPASYNPTFTVTATAV